MWPPGSSSAACTSCRAAPDPWAAAAGCGLRLRVSEALGWKTWGRGRGTQPYATCPPTPPPAAPAPSRAPQMPNLRSGHRASFSGASRLLTHPCQISLPHKRQALSSTLHPENHPRGAHTAQRSPRMNNGDPMTEPPHPLAVSLAPLATAETAAAGPGSAQLRRSFLPAACPWDGAGGGDSHTHTPQTAAGRPRPRQLPAPRYPPRVTTASSAQRLGARCENHCWGRGTFPRPQRDGDGTWGRKHPRPQGPPWAPPVIRLLRPQRAPPCRGHHHPSGSFRFLEPGGAGPTPASIAVPPGHAGCSGRGPRPPASFTCPLPTLGSAQEPPPVRDRRHSIPPQHDAALHNR